MKILYYASMLAGELDPPELILGDESESVSSDKPTSRSVSGQIPQVSSQLFYYLVYTYYIYFF